MNFFQKILHALGLYNPPETAAPAPFPIPHPEPMKPKEPIPGIPYALNIEATCPAPGTFGAVDLSQYCTQRFLDTMRHLKVGTILRYYDWPGSPTLREKIPTPAELALIKKNGFKFCGVFQHNNSKLASFTAARGANDIKVALDLAKAWKQPAGSAIYFGVDFDPGTAEMTAIKHYATQFSGEARKAGFKVGAYGSGFTLETLIELGLIDFAWLSMSTGFRRSKEFAASGRWNLKQTLDRNCGGINVDFNYVNPSKPDFGQWTLP